MLKYFLVELFNVYRINLELSNPKMNSFRVNGEGGVVVAAVVEVGVQVVEGGVP